MPIIRNSSSEHTGKKNVRQIYSGYRINVQANQLGIPAIPTTIKGSSGDIVQSLREGPVNFTPTELAAIVNNNSGSTVPSGPPGPPPLTFTSALPPTFPYNIPASYTLITFILIGPGGGGGGAGGGGPAGGGGGGAYIRAKLPVNVNDVVLFANGGGGGIDTDGGQTDFVYNTTQISITAGGGGAGSDGSVGYGGIVTGATSLVTVIQSASGIPGEYYPNPGGNNGNGGSDYGAGGIGGNNGAGAMAGNDGYWEFTIS
jgi:hypothetical protein